MKLLLLAICASLPFASLMAFVEAEFIGQMGNNLFQVATTCALAWDNHTEAYFPGLATFPSLRENVFSRCNVHPPYNKSIEYREPEFRFQPIPFQPNMRLIGFFQSEKYF